MDVFSEIEIEALVEGGLVGEHAQAPESLAPADIMALESELADITTIQEGAQNFDPFAPEWLESTSEIGRVIDSSIGEWLSAFMNSGSDVTANEKPTILFTGPPDEVVSTGSTTDDFGGSVSVGPGGNGIEGDIDPNAVDVVQREPDDESDDEGDEEEDETCPQLVQDLNDLLDLSGDGDSNDEAALIAGAVAAGLAIAGGPVGWTIYFTALA